MSHYILWPHGLTRSPVEMMSNDAPPREPDLYYTGVDIAYLLPAAELNRERGFISTDTQAT